MLALNACTTQMEMQGGLEALPFANSWEARDELWPESRPSVWGPLVYHVLGSAATGDSAHGVWCRTKDWLLHGNQACNFFAASSTSTSFPGLTWAPVRLRSVLFIPHPIAT
jgi:hypothetical protein